MLALKLVSLSTTSLPNVLECAQMFWSVKGTMCCVSFSDYGLYKEFIGVVKLEGGLAEVVLKKVDVIEVVYEDI